MSTLPRIAINRCRMRFAAATLYQLLKATDRKDFASKCDRLYRPGFYAGLSRDEAKAVHINPKWLRFLDEGVQLHRSCIDRLKEAKPELEQVFDNPLWQVLAWDVYDSSASARYLKTAKSCGQALKCSSHRARTNARMRWALGIPDWRRLALPLAILDLAWRGPQKRWLSKHFFNYLALATMHPAYHACYQDLWSLIDQWLSARKAWPERVPPLEWPSDITAFNQRCNAFKRDRAFLLENGWLLPSDLSYKTSIAMLWCIRLGGESLMKKIETSIMDGVRRCPEWLRRMMRDLDSRLDVRCS